MPRAFVLSALIAWTLAAWPSAAAAQADREPRPHADAAVRVLISAASGRSSVVLVPSAEAELVVDGRLVGRVAPGGRVETALEGGRLRVRGPGLSAEGGRVEVASDGALRVESARAARSYRGRLVLHAGPSGVQVVNHVGLADYVPSVVASEFGFAELEGAKAQAVLARTYALRRAAQATPGALFDVDDTERSQVYRGETGITATARRASEATHGEVLTYGGALIEAVYSSSSGGHTADNDAVWGTRAAPYLRGVPDPFDSLAPDHVWTTTADAARVHAALSRRFGGQVSHVEVAEHSREGRAVRVRLVGARTESVPAGEVRAAINAALGPRTVRSTHVRIERAGGVYRFEGRGFGHGVGMSQYGALGQSRAGRSHAEILRFYFRGVALERLPGSPAGPEADPWGMPPDGVAGVPERPDVRPTRRTGWMPAQDVVSAPQPVAPPPYRGEALVVPREASPPAARPADVPAAPAPRRAAW